MTKYDSADAGQRIARRLRQNTLQRIAAREYEAELRHDFDTPISRDEIAVVDRIEDARDSVSDDDYANMLRIAYCHDVPS